MQESFKMETTHSRRLGNSPGSSKVMVPFYVPPPSVKKTSAEIINEARASIRRGGNLGSISPSDMGIGVSPSVRPLDTKRPFTPRERQRTLFGSSNSYSRRPPSSFSLGYLQYQEPDLGSTTPPNLRRLNPLPFSPASSLGSSLNSSLSSSGSSAEQTSWRALVAGDAVDVSESLPSSFMRRENIGSAGLQTPKFLPCFDGSPPKIRLPAIGSGTHLLTRRNQFRATASLDNLPEEVEGEDLDSPGSSNSDTNGREPPPIRKAYSSPVQRTYSREVDLEKDIFGSLENSDLLSPTSNKRSLTFENENSRKKDKKLSNRGIVKKCKGDAWGPLQENVPIQEKVPRNLSTPAESEFLKPKETVEIQEITSNSEEHKPPSPFENKIENLTLADSHFDDFKNEKKISTDDANNMRIEGISDKMEEDLLDNQNEVEIIEKNKKCAQKEIERIDDKPPENSLPSSALTFHITNEKKTVKKTHCSEIIESSRMLQNLGMNDKSPPDSPDSQYLASAKAALSTDYYTDYSSNQNRINDIDSIKTEKVHSHITQKRHTKSPKPFLMENEKVHQERKNEPETNSVSEDPILGAIQKAMNEAFPPKDTGKRTQNISSHPKSGRARSAKKNTDQSLSDNVRSTLDTLTKLSEEEGNDIEVILALSKLYRVLDSEDAFGLNVKNTKLKSQVLKVIYKFVERSNETLLLQIARIILGFRVNGSNLSGVCKLVFKVSRCDKNDRLFLEDNILELFVEALGSASPLEDAEACVYGYGALKFLTMNNIVLSAVLSFGILELMVLHMKLVNVARAEGSRIPEQTSHALFQLTGALRNVAGEEDMFPQFVSTGAVAELCRAMELFSSDLDVISNVSRTLSIISTHDDCCNAIINYENCFHLFVKLLQKYPGRQDIVVRLGYALGNLMAKSETARIKLFEEEGAVSSMLNLLSIYLEKDQQMQDLEIHNNLISSDAGSNGSIEDVIVKIIRILANMSINPLVGGNLSGIAPEMMFKFHEDIAVQKMHQLDNSQDYAQSIRSNEYSNRFLGILLSVLRRKSLRESEELTHSALSSLNNLSYYTSCGDSIFGDRQLEIAEVMSPVLDSENKECLIEAMRVFGNLTRSQESRNFLLRNGDFSKLLKFLDCEDRELLSASAGILVNMMADWDKRVALKEDRGIERLLHILKMYCEGDWQLATLISQALWNYCIESTNLHAAFGIEETNELLGVLADYLDEERLFGVIEGTEANEALAASPVYQQWEEFAAVATNLLEKIDLFLDSLEPLEVLPSPIEELPEPVEVVGTASAPNVNGHEE